jgi:hypothetical protein
VEEVLLVRDPTPRGRRRLREVGGRIDDDQSQRSPFGVTPGRTTIESSVVGLTPSISAAPSFPRTCYPVISSTLRRRSRSVALSSRPATASFDDRPSGLMKSVGYLRVSLPIPLHYVIRGCYRVTCTVAVSRCCRCRLTQYTYQTILRTHSQKTEPTSGCHPHDPEAGGRAG